MGINLGLHERSRGIRIVRAPGATPLVVLAALLMITAVSCDTLSRQQKPPGAQGGAGSKPAADAAARHGAQKKKVVAAHPETKPAAGTNRVLLTQQSCIQCEPHWATIRVGQSLTWHSEVKAPVTVHVSPGAFDRTDYVVRAGQSVTTGPARNPGSYSIWTEPAACQGFPRGPRGAGPGVTVEGAAQR